MFLSYPSFPKKVSKIFYGYSVMAKCAENLHIIKFSEKKTPFTITRTKFSKSWRVSQKISQNFLVSRLSASIKPLQYARFLRIEKSFSLILQGNGAKNLHHFKIFLKKSLHYTKDKVNEKSVASGKIFSRKQKRPWPQTKGRTISRPFFAWQSRSTRLFRRISKSCSAQSSAPGYFRASYSHSQKIFFLRDMKPLGLFVLP